MLNKPAIYVIIGSFIFTLSGIFVKFIPSIPASEITFFRCVISLLFCYIALKKKEVSIWGNNKVLLVMRGIFGSIGLTTFYWTIQKIPLVVAISIQDLAPVFTILIAGIVLKEFPSRLQWILFGISFAGVYLIEDTGELLEFKNSELSIYPIAVGVFSAFMGGCAYNCIRKLKNSEDTLVIIFYFPLIALPLVGTVMLYQWVTPNLFEVLILLLVGISTQFAQFFITKAFQMKKAASVINYTYLSIVYSAVIGIVIWDEILSPLNFLGILFIVGSAIMNGYYEQKKSYDHRSDQVPEKPTT